MALLVLGERPCLGNGVGERPAGLDRMLVDRGHGLLVGRLGGDFGRGLLFRFCGLRRAELLRDPRCLPGRHKAPREMLRELRVSVTAMHGPF